MPKKKYVLNIAKEAEVLVGALPPFNDGTETRPMTVGDLICIYLQNAASREEVFASRCWAIGTDIVKVRAAGENDFELSELDLKFVKNVTLKGEMATWERECLSKAFAEAEERSKGT